MKCQYFYYRYFLCQRNTIKMWPGSNNFFKQCLPLINDTSKKIGTGWTDQFEGYSNWRHFTINLLKRQLPALKGYFLIIYQIFTYSLLYTNLDLSGPQQLVCCNSLEAFSHTVPPATRMLPPHLCITVTHWSQCSLPDSNLKTSIKIPLVHVISHLLHLLQHQKSIFLNTNMIMLLTITTGRIPLQL